MKQIIIFILTLSLSVSLSHPASAQKAVYHITASLNDNDNSLDGFLTLDYSNTSSDSVHFLWFNIYPNAFKSDRTAFSEYMLNKGRTDFYFSTPGNRGYINRLNFRSGDIILKIEDHPQYIDIIKVIFDEAVAPGSSKTITTPFHVKLPYNFDGIGYKNLQYDLKYWYPAVAGFIKPLTDVDSTSNLVADYSINFTVKKKFIVSSPLVVNESSNVEKSDSLKTITLSASSVKDVPVIVLKIQAKSLTKSPSAEHDIFNFLKKDPGLRDDNPKNDSGITKKIKNILSHPVLPAIGYNEYDGFQLGILTHNYQKQNPFSYYLAPVYTFKSKSIAGIAGASYKLYCHSGRSEESEQSDIRHKKHEIEAGFTASTFSYDDGVDRSNGKVFAKLFKIVPFIKVQLSSGLPVVEKSLTFKTYIINERDLKFGRDSIDPIFYQEEGVYTTRFVNELTFDYSSGRVLYPYRMQLQAQNGINWYRLNAAGNYFFNYPKGGGMNVRVFAAKFGYIGSLTSLEKFKNLRYMPKLTAVRGGEDYTYSNYFIGRNEFDGLGSRQIMMRDGGLKLRTDLFEGLQGRSDDWVASVNLNTSIPQIFPVKVPLKIFFDAGTYAEAWDNDYVNPRFLYVAGLQISLFKEVLNIYAPLFYSKQFRDQLKTVPEEDKFLKKVSFSVDLQKLSFRAARILR